MVFALKTCCMYLLSTEAFQLLTDLQVLRTALSKKDVFERMARWLNFFVEYDFQIVFRKGSKSKAANFQLLVCGVEELFNDHLAETICLLLSGEDFWSQFEHEMQDVHDTCREQ